PAAAQQSDVLATIDGQPITEAEIRAGNETEFKKIEREYERNRHDLVESLLQQLIENRLLAVEASTKNVTAEQLLAGIKPGEVTDADVDAFYEENKAGIGQAKERVAQQIRTYLIQQKQVDAHSAYIKGLEEKYKVVVRLEPVRVEVGADGPSIGPADAPVTMVEFTDFQCPFCSRVVPTLEKVRAKYGDKVRIVFRQFPLSIHPNARKAAEASLCAHEQGKFRQMHDEMFRNQQQLGVEQLQTKAADLGMDAARFKSCLDSGKFAGQVEADVRAADAVGVTGTPAIFINGRLISGAVPLTTFTKIIDEELARKAPPSASK
ncbi:MAG: thioredoxin domain-containing protein, partial [Acidobacteriota bacterium]